MEKNDLTAIRGYRVHHASGEPSVGEDVEVWEIQPARHLYLGLGRLVGFVRRAPLSRRLPFEGHAPDDDSPEEWAYREHVYRARGVTRRCLTGPGQAPDPESTYGRIGSARGPVGG